MRSTITVSIPGELKKQLDKISAEQGVSRSDVVQMSLRDYIFFRRFRDLREKMIPMAQAKGVYTDEDVFERMS